MNKLSEIEFEKKILSKLEIKMIRSRKFKYLKHNLKFKIKFTQNYHQVFKR